MNVQISPQALADAEAAYLWIHERAPIAAARWYNRLMETIEQLADHPERWPLAPEADLLEIELRQRLVGKRSGVYRILFTIHKNTVQVHRIRHAAQQFLTLEEMTGEE